ncbi:hypothetical protein [Microbispora bryophytorum]|uniref:hypothetical protein n=1 Tax=Microbispora bryophytorum TaxID=1460882 RepID=UPI0033FD7767
MGSSFKFDDREIKRLVDETVNEVARQYEHALDQMGLDLKGRPVEDIKSLVRARFEDLGGDITDPELTNIARAISEGTKISFNVQVED